MIERYDATYSGDNHTSSETVAHTATVYNSGPGTDTGPGDMKEGEGTLPSLEENAENNYNITKPDTYEVKSTDSVKEADIRKDDGNKEENTGTGKYDTGGKDDTAVKDDTAEKDGDTDKTAVSELKFSQMNDKAKKADTDEEKWKDFDKKTVYLTFDDGPSKYTEDILKDLAEYNVKATFFVIGKTNSHSKELYKKIVDEGHTLGMHSYSHDYKQIYKSVEDFDKDFTKLRDLLYDTTGYLPSIYRFPGGSSSVRKKDVSAFINYLNQKSVVYFDWNVVSGDATGVDYTAEQLYDNVINGIKLHNNSIVLMHDTDAKENTVKSLKQILKTLTEQGTELLPLNENVTPIQQVSLTE